MTSLTLSTIFVTETTASTIPSASFTAFASTVACLDSSSTGPPKANSYPRLCPLDGNVAERSGRLYGEHCLECFRIP